MLSALSALACTCRALRGRSQAWLASWRQLADKSIILYRDGKQAPVTARGLGIAQRLEIARCSPLDTLQTEALSSLLVVCRAAPLLALRLTAVRLCDSSARTLGRILGETEHLQSLTDLAMDRNKLTCDGIEGLSPAITRLARHTLLNLNLSANERIADRGACALVAALADSAPAVLTHLKLHGNWIGDGGVSALSTAMKRGDLPSLGVLDLQENRELGDAAVIALADAFLTGATQLRLLCLNGGSFGGSSVRHLAEKIEAGHAPNLEYLRLTHPKTDGGMYANRRIDAPSRRVLEAAVATRPTLALDDDYKAHHADLDDGLEALFEVVMAHTTDGESGERTALQERINERETQVYAGPGVPY